MEGHYEAYRAWVSKASEILERLERVDRLGASPVFSDLRCLKLALMPALGAVKNYEIFFSHLGGEGGRPSGLLADLIRRDFGSYEGFLGDFKATAVASRGWAALTYDLNLERLLITLGDSAEDLTVWNQAPILVMEVSEQSSAADFGRSRLNRLRYVDALLGNLEWAAVELNLEEALALRPAGVFN
jgi:Fe-Mn family superoxide dismutase